MAGFLKRKQKQDAPSPAFKQQSLPPSPDPPPTPLFAKFATTVQIQDAPAQPKVMSGPMTLQPSARKSSLNMNGSRPVYYQNPGPVQFLPPGVANRTGNGINVNGMASNGNKANYAKPGAAKLEGSKSLQPSSVPVPDKPLPPPKDFLSDPPPTSNLPPSRRSSTTSHQLYGSAKLNPSTTDTSFQDAQSGKPKFFNAPPSSSTNRRLSVPTFSPTAASFDTRAPPPSNAPPSTSAEVKPPSPPSKRRSYASPVNLQTAQVVGSQSSRKSSEKLHSAQLLSNGPNNGARAESPMLQQYAPATATQTTVLSKPLVTSPTEDTKLTVSMTSKCTSGDSCCFLHPSSFTLPNFSDPSSHRAEHGRYHLQTLVAQHHNIHSRRLL
jgi:hypothetical protein